MTGINIGGSAAAVDAPVVYVKTFGSETYAQLWKAGVLGVVAPAAVTANTDDYVTTPDLSPDSQRAVYIYENFTSGDNELRVIDLDGSNEDVLDDGSGGNCSACMWHPDGSVILYRVGDNILSIEPDGTNKATLVTRSGAGYPTYNADGTRIGYQAGTSLWIMDADGSNDTNVATLRPSTGAGLAWSSDDRCCFIDAPTTAGQTIRVINGDGTGETGLSSNPNPTLPLMLRRAWLPDDSATLVSRGGGSPWEMWSIDSGGGGGTATGLDMEADSGQVPFVLAGRVVYVDDGGDLVSLATDLSGPVTVDTPGAGESIEMQFAVGR